MKCPHCLTEIHEEISRDHIGQDAYHHFYCSSQVCPKCMRGIYFMDAESKDRKVAGFIPRQLFYPKAFARAPLSNYVPEHFKRDYQEAATVLHDSPKASAALSRRCLQGILRECAGVRHSTLFREIQEVIDSNQCPAHITDSLDTVRVVGNFAAHPIKSESTGEIIDVEPGEAEWNLDTLDALFDFYFVQPAKAAERRKVINEKLIAAGKKPLPD